MKLQPNRKCGWTEAPLGEKAYEVRELYEPQKEDHLSYIGLEHIEQQTLQLNGIGSSAETVSTKKAFKCGDILFGSLRPYFRKVVRPKFDGVCSTDITVIRVKQDTNQAFFFYFIANQAFIDHASNISSGTRMPRANWKVLEKSKWLFPPFTIQHKIASILSAYDDLIENNNRRIKILEEMAQAIYKEWFVNFRFPGHEKVKMVKSKLGMVPEGWQVTKLNEYVDFIRGIEPGSDNYQSEYKKGMLPFLRVGDLSKRASDLFIDEDLANNKIINEDDIVVSLDGTVGIVRIGLEGCYSTGIRKLEIRNHRIRKSFLYYLMQSEHIQNILKAHAKGSTIQHASAAIDYMDFILPPESMMNKFDEITNPVIENILKLNKINNNLRAARDLLLPKLISGEIDVEKISVKYQGGVYE